MMLIKINMDNKSVQIIILAVVILGTIDAIARNINNIINGFSNWWNSLAPVVQLVLMGLILYFIFKEK